ncbi:hypothetical protein OG568_59890 (plasmid) [Streptomyces sp. NBC_01450]|uniref:hypothetical protein n=1 Tax=Streptomyces sp. NBC_01450 TaxID=2903871 RepID=UPI002E32511C|nr:hypothetical protein [Streptomyces sp. NBC_01450]
MGQAQAKLCGFPAAGVAGQGEHGHPGEEAECEGDDVLAQMDVGEKTNEYLYPAYRTSAQP